MTFVPMTDVVYASSMGQVIVWSYNFSIATYGNGWPIIIGCESSYTLVICSAIFISCYKVQESTHNYQINTEANYIRLSLINAILLDSSEES